MTSSEGETGLQLYIGYLHVFGAVFLGVYLFLSMQNPAWMFPQNPASIFPGLAFSCFLMGRLGTLLARQMNTVFARLFELEAEMAKSKETVRGVENQDP
jgi:hypothetical protein